MNLYRVGTRQSRWIIVNKPGEQQVVDHCIFHHSITPGENFLVLLDGIIPDFMEDHDKTDYATCVKVSMDASTMKMIPLGAIEFWKGDHCSALLFQTYLVWQILIVSATVSNDSCRLYI
uniref:Uncharacterized protein n=1 Tax=Salix viminalis TaxID=40686 RepID=A0A6N2MTF8_SALVM